MKRNLTYVTVAALAMGMSAVATSQSTSPQPRTGTAERSLIGINLYDTGARVIAKFGSPDEILALSLGGNAGGAGGDAGGG
ncbi:hypothetical protein QM565_23075 [Geitlerinema splendidum]|nr:hypothetical protein [Geitlerinema splendidum]